MGTVEPRPGAAEAVDIAAKALLNTEWDWRVAGPVKHAAREHYSADCPLCRPDYEDNAQRIASVILDAAVPLLRAQIAAEIEDMEDLSKDDPMMVDKFDVATLVRSDFGRRSLSVPVPTNEESGDA